MRTFSIGGGAVVLLAALGLAACGSEAPVATATTIRIGATNFVTLPPTPSSAPTNSVAEAAAGTKIEGETTYVVQPNDYPSTVAARFKVDYAAFMALNGFVLDSRGFLPGWAPGLTVKIPAGATMPGTSGTAPTGATTTTLAGAPASATTAATQAAPATTAPAAAGAAVCASDEVYTIKEGDAPATVAAKFDTTVDALNALNGGTRGYAAFQVGIEIKIPAADC